MGCADTSISILFLRGDDAPDLLEEDVVDRVPRDLVSSSSSSSSADPAGTKTGLLCSCCCLRCNGRGVSPPKNGSSSDTLSPPRSFSSSTSSTLEISRVPSMPIGLLTAAFARPPGLSFMPSSHIQSGMKINNRIPSLRPKTIAETEKIRKGV